MTWRILPPLDKQKRLRGLNLMCSFKGKMAGTAGRMAYFIVVIVYNKGVICYHPYAGRITGKYFADFIQRTSTKYLPEVLT